ncbi:ATP-dependent zinc metalloprotease FtsH [Anoxybacterium hadale]|uniref:ATP-dependent zinc metalloprotease FtsH n=1 Tax=Anoxybacterium hadale TaxID=3408580 RepID=A0ACD1AEL1_9FIRM|nr:ATP-dependent zinc metalloprotease FtsH [Clostridiales bacterium]
MPKKSRKSSTVFRFLLLLTFLCLLPVPSYAEIPTAAWSSSSIESTTVPTGSTRILNRVDLSTLSKYVPVASITEDQFYDLNFGMRIASVAFTTENLLLLRTLDNQYCTIAMSEDYIKALELTGAVDSGASVRFASNTSQEKPKSIMGTFILVSMILGFTVFLIWFFSVSRKAYEPDKITVGTKEKPKNMPATPEKKITFDEVQGIDELKPDLFRLVDALKHPAKYKRLGARPTKGLILYGPPGTGKTLIAKAISGEAEVPFFSASGSDFVEKYVGVGASRIRELFAKARKASPCIVFIDELDAIGGIRGESNNSERDQTINALLTELDGFAASEGILTICATNRLDILDSALTRPGRFDLKIAVNLPDKQARYQILRLHSSGKKLSEEVRIDALAKKTNGFSGAELENLLNEAALIAATEDKDFITNDDIENAFFKLLLNGHKKERSEDDSYVRLVAYHEAGHTLATKLLTNDGVPTVTIVQSTSGAGGVTFRAPEDTPLKSKKYLKNLVKVMYAGRAAEEILLGSDEDITTGASEDIKQATEIIKQYIAIYGMGTQGMIDLTQLTNQFNMIEEASSMANELYRETLNFLLQNRRSLDRISLALLDKETLDEPEIDRLISGQDGEEPLQLTS